jgi:hypothetical protein
MPNELNFEQPINEGGRRYTLSRVAQIPEDNLLFSVEPADFGFYTNDNIEIYFYSKFTDELIYSQRVSITDDILAIKTIQYEDGKYRNYITFNFNKFIELYPLSIGPGEYNIVLNIFSDEIGSYENRKMTIDAISNSRTEVNLRFKGTPTERDIEELNYFISPSIGKPFVDGILQNILLNASQTSNENTGVTIDRVVRELNVIGEAFDLSRTDNTGRLNDIKVFIDQLMVSVYKRLQTELVSFPRYRIAESEIKLIIERSFYEEFNKIKELFRADIILT